jgi:diguanylate cyclase (GGDEF)-like protein/PAS domain S-box-containing protein
MIFETSVTDCQQIESGWRESEQRFKNLNPYIPGVIYSCAWDADRRIELIGDAIAEITGYPASDFMQNKVRTFASIIHPADSERVKTIVGESVSARRPYVLEYRLLHADGSIRWVYEKGQGIFSKSGKVLFLEGIIFDISEETERWNREGKQTELALQESEYRYYTLTTISPVGIFRTDIEGNCLYANPKWCEISGLKLEKIIGKTWYETIHPQERERITKEWKQWVTVETLSPKSLQVFKTEYRFEHPDGKNTWVLGQIVAEKDSRKKVIGYVGTLTEITDYKQIEAQLRQSEAKNRPVIESIPELLVVFNRDGAILECNASGKLWQKGMFDLEKALISGEVQNWEYRLPINENLRHREARIVVCRSHGNDEVLGIIRDLRDAVGAEQVKTRVIASFKQQAQILDQIHDAVISTDMRGYVTSWNQGAERLYGYLASEVLGKHISLIYPNDRHEFMQQQVIEPLLEKGTHEIEHPMLNKAGEEVYIHLKLSLLKDSQGRTTGMIGYGMDITDRKRNEEKLRLSEARNRAFLEALPDMIFRISKDGIFIDFHADKTSKMLMPDSSFIGKIIWDILPPELSQPTRRCVEQALKTGQIQLFEYWLPKNGKRHDYEARIVKSGADEVLAIVRDITERKQAEAALKQSEASYKELAESIRDVFFAMDKDFRYTYWNKAAEILTGIAAKDAIGKSLYDLFPDVRGTKAEQVYIEALRTQSSQSCIVEYQLGDSNYFFEISAYPSSRGGLSVFVKDITERKQAEEALRKSEQKLSLHVQQTPLAVIEVNNKCEIVEWNAAARAIFGYSKSEIIGQSAFVLVPEYVKEQVSQIWQDLMAQKGGTRSTAENITKDGRIIICEWYNTPLVDGDGNFIGVASLAQDVTERVRTEQALRHQAEQERLVATITQRIRQSLKLEEILNTAAREVQQLLGCDRVLVYRVWPEGTGSVITEAVLPGGQAILGQAFSEEVFPQDCYEQYKSGRIRAVSDVKKEASPCLAQMLQQFAVKSKLIAPLIQGDVLWGLLIAHQCSAVRQWQQFEINLLQPLVEQLAIAIQQASLFEQLEVANTELKRLACLDGLTGVANRRYFNEYFNREWQRLAREQAPLALILCDIDYFKQYNDTYGHVAGDLCLKQIAGAIQEAAKRPADLVARYGGEEFAIILPNTKAEGALAVAEEIQSYVKALQIPHAKSQVSEYVTLSLGISVTVPTPKSAFEQLISTADQALYEAKFQGRDRAVLKTFR